MPNDLSPDLNVVDRRTSPQRPERIDFIKCQTPECRHNLGVRLGHGRLYWHVPVIVDAPNAKIEITCPVCQARRIWTERKSR